MVIPLGGGMGGGMGFMQGGDDTGPPAAVKDIYAKYWWFMFAVLLSVCILEFVATDIFDAVFTGLMAVIVWYMVKKQCAQMSQYCLMMFGIMCAIQSIFEIISLVSSLGGRKTSHTSKMDLDNKSTSYTTVVESHPFFDPSQGFRYNVQSIVKIASPVTMLLCCLLCWCTYRAFPTSLFSAGDDDNDREALMGGGGNAGPRSFGGGGRLGGGMYGAGGAPGGQDGTSGGRAIGRPAAAAPRLFEGSGHRLGS